MCTIDDREIFVPQLSKVKLFTPILAVLSLASLTFSAQAAERADVENFLKITGFDVAVESIALGAGGAPSMLGLEEDAFGKTWTDLSAATFLVPEMVEQAVDLLEEKLEQDLLDHAVGFYESDLGQRLVQAENLAHFDDDELKQIAGRQIVAGMVKDGDPKIEYFQRMNAAIDPEGWGLKAIQQIQVRFLLAASRAGVIRRDLDEGMLWAQIAENEAETLRAMQAGAIAGAAYTYQDFSADELEIYAVALEDPKMQTVYELMNAVHYKIMGDRFDDLAKHLDKLRPSEDL